MNLEKICAQTCRITYKAGDFIRGEANKITADAIKTKGVHDFVTYVDRASEERIVKELHKILPEAGFVTEEKTCTTKGKHYTWIVDPLDGTTNFIHSIPCYCISIALMRDDCLVMGVVYEINLKECFYAYEGSKAYMNGKEIHVSGINSIDDSLFVTGFPYQDYSRLDKYLELFKYFMKYSHGVRRFGSAAADLAYVACGRVEGFFEYGLSPWDVAAGAFIVRQAGGKVSDFNGGDDFIFGKEVIAGGSAVFDEFLSVVRKHLG